ncbi:serine/threonine-protein kinase fray2-like isoform X1 [Iris pallida]|uniref:Serine/threonine-protein kinase fray2-like isoform X1 n=1 Tax=Iris pallida TaxID=29817 RepID=A0AAX6DU93_IRIPA|nr:serine/threonine-protein kinase fray2-like isoform X1 [Iris pallida]
MASSEPSLSPECLKAAKTADDHNSGTSSARNRPPLLETPRVRTIMKPVDYTNFGRRGDRWRNAGNRDRSGRSVTDAPWRSRPDGPAVRRRVPIKRDFPAPVAETRKKPSSPVHIAPVSSGLNVAVPVAQMSSRARADPQFSVDTHRSSKSVLTESKQVKPLTPKTSGLNSSEKPKFKGAMAGKELLSQLVVVNNALRACTLGSDVSKASQVGNLQVLNRERNATVSSSGVVEDVNDSDGNLKSPTNQNLKVECKDTSKNSMSSLKRSSCCFGKAQDRINILNSLNRKAPSNLSTGVVPDPGGCIFDASEKSSSLDGQNSGDYAGASVINQEVDVNGNGGIGRVIDGDGALGEEVQNEDFQSETHVDNKENCNQPSWSSDDNYEQIADVDEEEASFLRSLGWEEHAQVEAIKDEEIAAFKKQYESLQYEKKLRPLSELSFLS